MSYRLEGKYHTQTDSYKTLDIYIRHEGESERILDGEIKKKGSEPAYYETSSIPPEILNLQDIEDIAKALKEVDKFK